MVRLRRMSPRREQREPEPQEVRMETPECDGRRWPYYLGVGLGVAATAAAAMLLTSERGKRTREELASSLSQLRQRLSTLGERVSAESRSMFEQQREALQEAIAAGRQAADRRAAELRARYRHR